MPEDNIAPSPLSEADPNSLDELFSRIDQKLIAGLPREITDTDIEALVTYYRKERVRFVEDQANNIKPGRKAKTPPKNIAEALKNIEF